MEIDILCILRFSKLFFDSIKHLSTLVKRKWERESEVSGLSLGIVE
jgi:hypothetical protein